MEKHAWSPAHVLMMTKPRSKSCAIQSQAQTHMPTGFTTPDELARKVAEAIYKQIFPAASFHSRIRFGHILRSPQQALQHPSFRWTDLTAEGRIPANSTASGLCGTKCTGGHTARGTAQGSVGEVIPREGNPRGRFAIGHYAGRCAQGARIVLPKAVPSWCWMP